MKSKYTSNIWKSYLFVFFKEALLFSAVLIPFFTIWGGISFSQVMILQAIFTLSIFILEIPTGAISDRFSRKLSLMIGSLISIVGFLVYASYPSFWVFASGEFILAVGFSLFSGADRALLYDSLKKAKKEKQSKKIFGRLGTFSLIGIMFGSIVGSVVAKYLGLRATMLLSSIPMVISFFVALSLNEPKSKRKTEDKHYIKDMKQSIKSFRKHPILKILTFDYIFIMALAFFVVWVYQVVLTDVGINIVWFGFVNAGMIIAEIIILNQFSFFEKLVGGKRNYLFLSAIIPGICFILLGIFTNWVITIGAIVLIAGFGLTRRELSLNYLNKYIESENRATVLSTISMLYAITVAIANLILGHFVDINLRYTLIVLGIVIFGIAFLSKVKEEHLID